MPVERKTCEVCIRENGRTYIIGEVNYEVYATIDEAVQHQGAEAVLKLINNQHKINVMSNFRRSYKCGPTAAEISAACTKLACSPKNIRATTVAAQDPDPNVYIEYMNSIRQRVTAELLANRKTKILKSERSVDDNDNNNE